MCACARVTDGIGLHAYPDGIVSKDEWQSLGFMRGCGEEI